MAVSQPLSSSLPSAISSGCDQEEARIESWLDEHPGFFQNYLIRKGNRALIDAWLVSHALPPGTTRSAAANDDHSDPGSSVANQHNCVSPSRTSVSVGSIATVAAATSATATTASTPTSKSSTTGSGSGTPVRKISAHEFEKGGLTKPLFNTIDGAPTFLSPPGPPSGDLVSGQIRKRSRNDVKGLDETELIFELVKDICNDLDTRRLCHKILQNVGLLTNADRCVDTLLGSADCESWHSSFSLRG